MDTHYDIIHLDEVASTQDRAHSIHEETGRPTLVVADRQTQGRGRQGRTWIEPDAAMYSSFCFVPATVGSHPEDEEATSAQPQPRVWDHADLPLVPLMTAIAVRRALRSMMSIDVGLKWPNDLFVGDRKVGGILVEGSGGVVTVGCGINLRWRDPPAFAAAILEDDDLSDVASTLAAGWVDGLVRIVVDGAARWPIDEYRTACVTLGRMVRWDGGLGRAVDVDPTGALVVVSPQGSEVVVSGDVHLLGES